MKGNSHPLPTCVHRLAAGSAHLYAQMGLIYNR